MTTDDELAERRTARARATARARTADALHGSRPAIEPGGKIYEANLAAHGGKPYRGGPVCWDPRVSCEGICRDCPREATS